MRALATLTLLLALGCTGGKTGGNVWNECGNRQMMWFAEGDRDFRLLSREGGSWRSVPGTDSVEYRSGKPGQAAVRRLKPGERIECN